MNTIHKKIYKEIKNAKKIVIARHIGPDPDALGSSIGLKEIIKATFPEKEVYVVGSPASRFKFIGNLDKFNEDMYIDSLLIVTDTPDKRRVDSVEVDKFDKVIKIDHHPFIEDFGGIEYIDDTASSASQLVMELVFNTKLKITKEAAEKLYVGLIADTNRFLFAYTTPKTFELVARLIKETNLDFTKLYDNLYLRPFNDLKFKAYITNNLNITENGCAYIWIPDEDLEKYSVDAATAGNMVNDFNYINEYIVWAVFSEDKTNNNIRVSVRSRGPVINEVASHFNGGGHIYASGARLTDKKEIDKFVKELDNVCREYKET